MTIFDPFSSRQVFWDIIIQKISMRKLNVLKKSISKITVIYESRKPTIATVDFNSNEPISDLFRTGHDISISFGYQPTNLVNMISGKCIVEPAGSAEGTLKSKAKIIDGIFKMTKLQKNKVWGLIPTKTAIITQVITASGFIPVVSIPTGTLPLQLKDIPVQRAMTDLQFLYRCAEKWNCTIWKEDNFIYFVDDNSADDFAGALRLLHGKIHINDFKKDYFLYFRTRNKVNNVKNISWGYKKTSGKPKMSEYATRRAASAIEAKAFEVEAYGEVWLMRQGLKRAILADSEAALLPLSMISTAMLRGEMSRAREFLNLYYVQKADTSTNENKKIAGGNRAGNMDINITLNKGDPYLRVPRKGYLIAGDGTKGSLQLPHHVLKGKKANYVYINKVQTEITNGMLQTKILASLGRI